MMHRESVARSVGGSRRSPVRVRWHFYVLTVMLCSPLFAKGQVSVLTQHYDNARTGQNTNETVLTTTSVNSATFGKWFALPVDGYVYAQPLYVPNVAIPLQGTHNVLYVATEHDSVYAFDADKGGAPLWQVSLLVDGDTTYHMSCQEIVPEVGVTGTPVIDPSTNTLYVDAKSSENGNAVHRLHALDITTGAEKFGGPVLVQATVPGTGVGGNGTNITFMAATENQREGLLLDNGYVYLGFGSHCDYPPFHGWILAYNASTLVQSGAWATTPNGTEGGIWNTGCGMAA